jgi:homocysteine S-methyltransferase
VTVVLDGGLATQLEARGNDLSDALWSARLLADAPEEILAVHRDFFAAGARVATTASYQASYSGFAERGFDRSHADVLIRRSVELARQARDDCAGDGVARWVAASVGPYGAVLADGSEYRGRYGLSGAQLRDFHLPRIEALVSAEPDFLAIETIPDLDEAEVVVATVAQFDIPTWLSFTVADGMTRAGQPLAEAFAVAAGQDHIVAVGVNCCAPGDVATALETARAVTGRPGVAYPNSGEAWDAGRRAWVGPAGFDTSQARAWAAAGATFIGGCCRVRPADIQELALAMRDRTD